MINTLNSLLIQKGEGVIYLDDQVNVLASNELASEIFQRRDGLLNQAGKLFFSDKEAHGKILSRLAGFVEGVGEPIFARRENDVPPYKVNVASFEDEWLYESKPKPCSLVLVSETDKSLDFPAWIFSDYYKLTRSEMLLAEALFNDLSLQEYASERGIKVTTVRWTLDNIFSKTYTHSQKELKSLAIKYAL